MMKYWERYGEKKKDMYFIVYIWKIYFESRCLNFKEKIYFNKVVKLVSNLY